MLAYPVGWCGNQWGVWKPGVTKSERRQIFCVNAAAFVSLLCISACGAVYTIMRSVWAGWSLAGLGWDVASALLVLVAGSAGAALTMEPIISPPYSYDRRIIWESEFEGKCRQYADRIVYALLDVVRSDSLSEGWMSGVDPLGRVHRHVWHVLSSGRPVTDGASVTEGAIEDLEQCAEKTEFVAREIRKKLKTLSEEGRTEAGREINGLLNDLEVWGESIGELPNS